MSPISNRKINNLQAMFFQQCLPSTANALNAGVDPQQQQQNDEETNEEKVNKS